MTLRPEINGISLLSCVYSSDLMIVVTVRPLVCCSKENKVINQTSSAPLSHFDANPPAYRPYLV